ncbi:Acyl-CoA oxidase/dehydrogenase type 1 [Macrophomina phaseolina MS6]|uniref:Acyl-CoA oxidase/dehydrogenase type 1 n=1 Tax=Macrophomina phaseolina (strain MS6) TaxID=1126212 RepID=K2S1J9_MACPH|nr:Acyl-CoA oxidase/dehydrogenase type 1 [Macrophomina phaseolina MS6]
MVDFTLSPSEAATRTAARAFAHAHLRTAPALYGSIPATRPDLRFQSLKPIYEAAVAGGLIKGMVPKELGGAMGSLVEMCVCVEECYAVDPTASLTIFGTGLGLAPLLAAWREGLEPFLEPFLRGTGAPVASLVYSEPGGVLWATNSAGFDFRGADLACVVCRCTNADAQAAATRPEDLIMVLLVTPADIARNAAGSFEVLQHPQTAGHTAVSGPHIRYAGLRVPQGNLLCAPGTGVPVVTGAFQMSAALVGAMGTGIGRAAFDAALAFAKGDARGGSVPIVEHQSVADLLINIKMRTETSRYLTWKAAQALTSGKGHELALEAKIYCSDAAVKSAIDAINLVGVSAYDTSRPFTGFLNDAMVLPIFDGGNVGIRRRDLQKLFMSKDYSPWGASLE